jgi:SAM-dependent methyltransferase
MSTLHLGSGQNTLPDAHNVDRIDHAGVDETVDLKSYPWPWDDASYEYILAEHVFEHLPDMERTLRECSRILTPGGRLELALPIGQDVTADPDHKHEWTWDTPAKYCGERPWDADVGLDVIDKQVELWPHYPGIWKYIVGGLLSLAVAWYEPHRWCFDIPNTSGEFRVVFQK